ncbi:MAG: acyltransferase [Treponema sp.]|nr:acyltransferase [Treponema sp.]
MTDTEKTINIADTTAAEPQKKPLIPENISKRITALRYLLIMLVVFAHNNKTYLFMTDPENFSLVSKTFFTHIPQVLNYTFFGQAAVPLFFMFSAYLLAKKNDPYKLMLKKKTKALLTPYLLWPAVTIGIFILAKAAAILIFPDKVNHTLPYVSDWTLEDWICAFIGKYPKHYGNSLFEPYIGPFYYLRDLLIMNLISPVLIYLIKKCRISYFVMMFGIFLYAPLFLIGYSGLLYYSLGLFFGLNDIDFFELADRAKWKFLIPAILITWILTINRTAAPTTLLVITACIFMLKFSKLISDNQKAFGIAKYLASFSFFLYAIHEPKFLNFLVKLWYKFIPAHNSITDTLEFFIVGAATCGLGTLIGIAMKKIMPKVFYMFNGGR